MIYTLIVTRTAFAILAMFYSREMGKMSCQNVNAIYINHDNQFSEKKTVSFNLWSSSEALNTSCGVTGAYVILSSMQILGKWSIWKDENTLRIFEIVTTFLLCALLPSCPLAAEAETYFLETWFMKTTERFMATGRIYQSFYYFDVWARYYAPTFGLRISSLKRLQTPNTK